MATTYKSIIPWGRLFSEYAAMFSLTETDLTGSILGCGDGPASFNAEATAQGYRVTSVDPIYAFSAAQIEERVQDSWRQVLAQMREHIHLYVWDHFADIDALGAARLSAMRIFVDDLEQGKQERRYLEASLPHLPFSDDEFDLALCSHFLFLYSDHVSLEGHIAGVREMCRVAREVRIFPLHDLNNEDSRHIEPVVAALAAQGYQAERVRVNYEFQRGANEMLRIVRG